MDWWVKTNAKWKFSKMISKTNFWKSSYKDLLKVKISFISNDVGMFNPSKIMFLAMYLYNKKLVSIKRNESDVIAS